MAEASVEIAVGVERAKDLLHGRPVQVEREAVAIDEPRVCENEPLGRLDVDGGAHDDSVPMCS